MCILSQHVHPEHPLTPCVDEWQMILDKRASERKKYDEKIQERAAEKLRLRAALEQLEKDEQAANKESELAEKGCSEEIAKRHQNVQMAMLEITQVNAQLREAEKNAAAAAAEAAAKATVARQQVKKGNVSAAVVINAITSRLQHFCSMDHHGGSDFVVCAGSHCRRALLLLFLFHPSPLMNR